MAAPCSCDRAASRQTQVGDRHHPAEAWEVRRRADLTPEEVKWRGDAADALCPELVRQVNAKA
jgi:hypothetical protein